MQYCSIEDLFESCKESAVLSWAKDDPKDSPDTINKRISSAIDRAGSEVDLFIGKIYPLPLSRIPSTLKDITVKLALYQLLSRRGLAENSADNVIKANRNSALRKLEQISLGKLSVFKDEDHHSNNNTIISFFPPSVFRR